MATHLELAEGQCRAHGLSPGEDVPGPEAMEMYWTFRFKALKGSEQRNDLISHFNKITLVAVQKTDFSGTKVEEGRTTGSYCKADKNYTPIKINELI